MNTLYLIRGIPGSGKSTLAQKLARQLPAKHYEADQFHMVDGEYKFDPARIPEAHQMCKLNAISALQDGANVVVSNTFTRDWEMDEYIAAAVSESIPVVIIECTTEYGSIHNVPEKIMDSMRKRWIHNSNLIFDLPADSNLSFKKAEDFA